MIYDLRFTIWFRRATFALLLSAINSQLSTAFAQGSLTPPGAPAPTMKSLAQIEPRTPIPSVPFTITASGSYYLTTNLATGLATNGITIQADDVTVDLNGFALVGAGSFSGTFNGIHVPAMQIHLCIRNGTIRNWGNNGIDSYSSNTRNCQIERIRASHNGGNGVAVGPGSTVIACAAATNYASGYFIGDGAVVIQCTATANGVLSGSGFSLGNGVTIKDCSAADNLGDGIVTADGTTISDCTVRGNKRKGISVISRCRVTDNNCITNGSSVSHAGISVSSIGNRIEGNNLVNNSSGIRDDGGGNWIVRNSARSNTFGDYIGGGLAVSAVGEILNFSAGGTITNSNPWANFRY